MRWSFWSRYIIYKAHCILSAVFGSFVSKQKRSTIRYRMKLNHKICTFATEIKTVCSNHNNKNNCSRTLPTFIRRCNNNSTRKTFNRSCNVKQIIAMVAKGFWIYYVTNFLPITMNAQRAHLVYYCLSQHFVGQTTVPYRRIGPRFYLI